MFAFNPADQNLKLKKNRAGFHFVMMISEFSRQVLNWGKMRSLEVRSRNKAELASGGFQN